MPISVFRNPERRRSCPRSAGRSPCCTPCWITDFISAAQLLQQKIGIDLTPEEISHTALMSDIENGNFQLALDNLYGGPTPYR
jgi:peptide/nickel transport system substrate-binding protein